MQIKYPHRKFYRLDATRDELSPQAAERFDADSLSAGWLGDFCSGV